MSDIPEDVLNTARAILSTITQKLTDAENPYMAKLEPRERLLGLRDGNQPKEQPKTDSVTFGVTNLPSLTPSIRFMSALLCLK